MKKIILFLATLFGFVSRVKCFSYFYSPGILPSLSRRETNSHITSTSLEMAKRKMSMAEKRKRRQAKQQTKDSSYVNLPPSKLENMNEPPEEEDQPDRYQDPTEAAEKAKE